MAQHVFNIVAVVFLLLVAGSTWLIPRRIGWPGIFVAHLAVLVGYFVFAGVAIAFEQYEYDGMLSHLGLVLQVFVLNSVLLPVTFLALWRRRRAGNT